MTVKATQAQLESYELFLLDSHLDDIDEDVSTAGLLVGRGDMSVKRYEVA